MPVIFQMSISPTPSVFRRTAGWLLVCAYLSAVPGILPAVVAAIATVCGGHEVSLANAHGDWDVVLHHPDHEEPVSGNADDRSTSTAFQGEDHEDDGDDHRLHFSTTASHAVAPSMVAATVHSCHELVPSLMEAPQRTVLPVPVTPATYFARPPPGRTALLVCLKTIVIIV
jgi:hypothetical protein